MDKLIVINLYGGPGAGKSTYSSLINVVFKDRLINSEGVTEYAKKLVLDNSQDVLKDQLLVFANQHREQFRLVGHYDVAVTDSPLLLSVIYDEENDEDLRRLVIKKYKNYHNINILLNRRKPYFKVGRNQNEGEAKEIDIQVKNLLDELGEPYRIVDGTFDAIYDFSLKLIDEINELLN